MSGKKHTSLDRVLGRLDTLDAVNLAQLVQRLARERGLFEDIFNTLQEGVLVMRLTAADEAATARMQKVVADHLLRFAFREPPQVVWREG